MLLHTGQNRRPHIKTPSGEEVSPGGSNVYLREIVRIPLLSAEDEQVLGRQIKYGDKRNA